jgi:hypothetical protein
MGPLNFDGSDQELEFTWAELERWIDRLETMGAKTGRNNTLNAVAYYAGSKAVMAGHGYQEVRERLIAAGTAVGTHGIAATVDSGLSSGIATLKKQQAGVLMLGETGDWDGARSRITGHDQRRRRTPLEGLPAGYGSKRLIEAYARQIEAEYGVELGMALPVMLGGLSGAAQGGIVVRY